MISVTASCLAEGGGMVEVAVEVRCLLAGALVEVHLPHPNGSVQLPVGDEADLDADLDARPLDDPGLLCVWNGPTYSSRWNGRSTATCRQRSRNLRCATSSRGRPGGTGRSARATPCRRPGRVPVHPPAVDHLLPPAPAPSPAGPRGRAAAARSRRDAERGTVPPQKVVGADGPGDADALPCHAGMTCGFSRPDRSRRDARPRQRARRERRLGVQRPPRGSSCRPEPR